jgi:hypothetical protein
VVENYLDPENAENLWESIILENKDQKEIKELSKIYIIKIFEFEVKLIKDYFKIENNDNE